MAAIRLWDYVRVRGYRSRRKPGALARPPGQGAASRFLPQAGSCWGDPHPGGRLLDQDRGVDRGTHRGCATWHPVLVDAPPERLALPHRAPFAPSAITPEQITPLPAPLTFSSTPPACRFTSPPNGATSRRSGPWWPLPRSASCSALRLGPACSAAFRSKRSAA